MNENYSSIKLILAIIWHPTYRVLLCADSAILPSPWTDKFRVEVDHNHKVIRLSGDLT